VSRAPNSPRGNSTDGNNTATQFARKIKDLRTKTSDTGGKSSDSGRSGPRFGVGDSMSDDVWNLQPNILSVHFTPRRTDDGVVEDGRSGKKPKLIKRGGTGFSKKMGEGSEESFDDFRKIKRRYERLKNESEEYKKIMHEQKEVINKLVMVIQTMEKNTSAIPDETAKARQEAVSLLTQRVQLLEDKNSQLEAQLSETRDLNEDLQGKLTDFSKTIEDKKINRRRENRISGTA